MKRALLFNSLFVKLQQLIKKRYVEISLIFLFIFMLWVRMRSYTSFFIENQIYLAGNDPWYHLRMVNYTILHWPSTMPFDIWTNFPYGTHVGQFGTLYDQIIATIALIIGLGNPSVELVLTILIVTPAIIGSLIIIPTYLIGKHFSGKMGGLFSVILLSLLPGQFLHKGLAGFADHHVAEPLFQSFAILTLIFSLTICMKDRPVWELVEARNINSLKRPLFWGILTGFATLVYLWIWPPGVLLIGIFALFYLFQSFHDHISGLNLDYIAFIGTTSMLFVGIALLFSVDLPNPDQLTSGLNFRVTTFSLLHPMLAFSLAIACSFSAWLSRFWKRNNLSRWSYPFAILILLSVLSLVFYLLFPDVFGILRRNLIRTFGFNISEGTKTIAEAQSLLSLSDPSSGISWIDVIRREYGFIFFTGLFAPILALINYRNKEKSNPGIILLFTWFFVIGVSAFTQLRFNYYFAVPLVILNGYVLAHIFNLFKLCQFQPITLRKIGVISIVFLLFLAPLAIPMQIGGTESNPIQSYTVFNISEDIPMGDVVYWDSALQWMKTNTPAEGTYGGSSNKIDYYGTIQQNHLGPSGAGDFEYPSGAYGVMSWWDYGHWITLRAERIPVANPFQEGAVIAANYLLSQNELESEEILETINEGSGVRYVMLDWQIVSPGIKLYAPTIFKDGVSQSDFQQLLFQQTEQNIYSLYHLLHPSAYYKSQMVRLYHYHGSAINPLPIVIDWEPMPGFDPGYNKSEPVGESSFHSFSTIEEAEFFVENTPTSQIGGIGTFSTESISALEHYRLVYASPDVIQISPYYVHTDSSWVKIFERVPGAEITGITSPNSIVMAKVTMNVPTTASEFNYTQYANSDSSGKFSMTLPYSTTGYGEYGPQNGYTNTNVRSTGAYVFSVNSAGYYQTDTWSVHIPDSAVNGIENNIYVELK